jgi:hypothetical protein
MRSRKPSSIAPPHAASCEIQCRGDAPAVDVDAEGILAAVLSTSRLAWGIAGAGRTQDGNG